MGVMQIGICRMLNQQMNAKITELNRVKDAVTAPITQAKSLMSSLVGEAASSPSQITGGLSSMSSAISSSIPSTGDLNEAELLSMASSCTILGDILESTSAQNIINSFTNNLNDALSSAMDSVFDSLASTVPEFSSAQSLLNIESTISGCGVGDMLSSIDDYISCLTGTCGTDVSSSVDQVNQLLEDMYLDSTGVLDRSRIYAEAGISTSQQANITSCVDGITSQLSDAASNLSDAASNLGNVLKK